MSKSSQKLKNSKVARAKKAEKSAKKAAAKSYQKHLEAATAPASFSLKTDNFGRTLSSAAQLTLLALGIFGLGFAVVFTGTFVIDFLSVAEDGYGLLEYLNLCEPAAVCRFMDVSELFVILAMLFISIVCLRTALANRYPHRRTVVITFVVFIVTVLLYSVDFILNRVLWAN